MTSELEFRMHSLLTKETLAAPTAAELTRKLRRLRDNDIADMIIFVVGFTSLAALLAPGADKHRSSTEGLLSVYACIAPENLYMLVMAVKDRTRKGD
jgi:hypothetical protein